MIPFKNRCCSSIMQKTGNREDTFLQNQHSLSFQITPVFGVFWDQYKTPVWKAIDDTPLLITGLSLYWLSIEYLSYRIQLTLCLTCWMTYPTKIKDSIIAQPREHCLRLVSALTVKSAAPAEKLIIMAMIWKTCGLYENNFKNTSIKLRNLFKIMGFGLP